MPKELTEANANIQEKNLIANGPFGLAKGIKREEFDITLAKMQAFVLSALD